MYSTVDLFDLLTSKYCLKSDAALARLLGVTPATISTHRARSYAASNELALKMAELLGYDPAFVLACVCYESAKCASEKDCFFRLAALAKLHPERQAARLG